MTVAIHQRCVIELRGIDEWDLRVIAGLDTAGGGRVMPAAPKSFVLSTAGHVDHGKSALNRALTGIEPDRWDEEQRRGMTLDLGFAWSAVSAAVRVACANIRGLLFGVRPDFAESVLSECDDAGLRASLIGEVSAGRGRISIGPTSSFKESTTAIH